MLFEFDAFGIRRLFALFASILVLPLMAGNAPAQDEADEEELIEEIVTVGSQIRGATISEALAVSIIDSQDIEDLGIDSGDELLEFMSEQGSNFFAEAESLSGGVNAARGDIGAYNLRGLGTGNTLVLLNGRRLVNAASYQTESVGGSFIPVNTVNSQSMPVAGLERVEVLRDGASAIYGADAVAGVVNYVTKTDFEGLTLRAKYADYEGLPRNDHTLTLEWGKNFNGGATNVSVFANFYHRDRVSAADDPRWADTDHRDQVPEDSPWFGNTSFRRSSLNSEYGQFDIAPDGRGNISYGLAGLDITDARGEFHVYPAGRSECEWVISANVCGREDTGNLDRYNLNEFRNLYSDLDRTNIYLLINHEFNNGVESFTELSAYITDTFTTRDPSAKLSAVAKYSIAPDAYYNPFGPCGSPNRIPEADVAGVPCEGIPVIMDNYRFTAAPRQIYNDGETYRILQGFRGQMGSWDWEAAAFWSRATKEDITHDRVSNTLIQAALNDPTASGYNPFNGGVDTNLEQALIDVRRDNETEITSIDFKISKPDLFELPSGAVGFLAGAEFRDESFLDDRDPRLDGTIEFIDNAGNRFPIISDVLGSSPTLDSNGSRDVTSLFAELQVPVLDNFDLQLAMRYEDFSDIGDTTVGKVAFGWRPFEPVLLRGSWSEAYRVPNLVTVNESGVARSNAIDDEACFFADPDEIELDCNYSMQRTAGGSDELIPEKSDNTSIGIVLDVNDHLTFTLDHWQIKKDDTIGLFGERNHTALDLLLRIEAGNSNCASVAGNPAVVRDDPSTLDPVEAALYDAAGICPIGQVSQVNDVYKNLDTRNIRGHDIGVYFDYETSIGEFNFKWNGSFLDKYAQLASGPAQVLLDGVEDGTLPADIGIVGFDNLLRVGGNPRVRQSARLHWRKNDWGASVSGTYVSDFWETRLTLPDGTRYVLPSMQTYNASVDYRFNTFGDTNTRLRFGVVNLTDERAPLSSERFGYESDVHRDMPRSFYLDLRLAF